jgi:hypothetical protein
MFGLGVVLVALAILFALTALAFRSNDQLSRGPAVAAGLGALLAVGIVLLLLA